ncbi:uncharacterized protein NECHADRAFT_82525 [Fusarium vanettenii 77-13-4]|uniref:NAD(P)-binding domain-containing protein n=1 Tax=Fusarium vanettenii (strain ATCC MYA-4622 / CBS 123669 / FGSC 9596 / NRRL 45880 / 77-13-4) TaxID=660122 RepID=C7YXG9_FUSV7|nr:uncharacterized protein NECHADRAFT_82525 [Fusarium vanettenii 77-13-4]EEU43588.1 hypothetical protein NECHADRAFT_82525 [Fusarium vanettenii 77-13-4]
METVLVVGATGNIGVSAVKAALNTGRNVIAVTAPQDNTDSGIVGAFDLTPRITDISTEAFRKIMNVNLEANFFAYRATTPYLLKQKYRKSTWTLMTGAAGDSGWAGVTAISQGALFSLANIACRELAETNIRSNEVWLAFRVKHDKMAAKNGSIGSFALAPYYEQILSRPEISANRVRLAKPADISSFTWSKKFV